MSQCTKARAKQDTRVRCGNKPQQISLNHAYHMAFVIIQRKFQCSPLKKGNVLLHAIAVSRASPMVTSHGIPWRWDLSPHDVRRQGTLKSLISTCLSAVKSNSAALKYIYNEFTNLTDSCGIDVHTNVWRNLQRTVPVIGMDRMVTRARLRCTRDYLTPGIYSQIKTAAVEKRISFPANIHTPMI